MIDAGFSVVVGSACSCAFEAGSDREDRSSDVCHVGDTRLSVSVKYDDIILHNHPSLPNRVTSPHSCMVVTCSSSLAIDSKHRKRLRAHAARFVAMTKEKSCFQEHGLPQLVRKQ